MNVVKYILVEASKKSSKYQWKNKRMLYISQSNQWYRHSTKLSIVYYEISKIMLLYLDESEIFQWIGNLNYQLVKDYFGFEETCKPVYSPIQI